LPLIAATRVALLRIDCSRCKDKIDLFEAAKQELGFPHNFGMNWDAFNDIVCEFDHIEDQNLVVLWCGFKAFAQASPSDAALFVEICRDFLATGTPTRTLRISLRASVDKPIDLEALIGLNNESEGAQSLDDKTLRANLKVLSRRSTPEDFEKHFAMFNALTLLPHETDKDDLLDEVDAVLEQYILTSRSESQGDSGADVMLNDLIVDHWPVERALRLSAVILERCRYRHRVESFLYELNYHRKGLRPPELREGLLRMARDYVQSSSPRLRALGGQVLNILERSDTDWDYHFIRVPVLNPRN
jgi:RNAse (barnase) inhibitor barstar